MDAYINLRYSNNKIVMDYYLSKFISVSYKSVGITSKIKNLRETKDYILGFIKSSPENKIIIKSELKSKIGGSLSQYSKIRQSTLKKLADFLNKEQKDIKHL